MSTLTHTGRRKMSVTWEEEDVLETSTEGFITGVVLLLTQNLLLADPSISKVNPRKFVHAWQTTYPQFSLACAMLREQLLTTYAEQGQRSAAALHGLSALGARQKQQILRKSSLVIQTLLASSVLRADLPSHLRRALQYTRTLLSEEPAESTQGTQELEQVIPQGYQTTNTSVSLFKQVLKICLKFRGLPSSMQAVLKPLLHDVSQASQATHYKGPVTTELVCQALSCDKQEVLAELSQIAAKGRGQLAKTKTPLEKKVLLAIKTFTENAWAQVVNPDATEEIRKKHFLTVDVELAESSNVVMRALAHRRVSASEKESLQEYVDSKGLDRFIHRGMGLPQDFVEKIMLHLKAGSTLEIDQNGVANSWSVSLENAKGYAEDAAREGRVPVVIRVPLHRVQQGTFIGKLSTHASEEEFVTEGKLRLIDFEKENNFFFFDAEFV